MSKSLAERLNEMNYDPIKPLEECNWGLDPIEYKVVILAAKQKNKTKGGIILTDDTTETLSDRSQIGLVCAISPLAFNYDAWPNGPPVSVGDVVLFGKFAGGLFKGADGDEYRFCNDKDIIGVMKE